MTKKEYIASLDRLLLKEVISQDKYDELTSAPAYPYGLTEEQLEDVEQQAVNKITEEASEK